MKRFLCTADLHIGRLCSGFDDDTPLIAFHRLAEIAIRNDADGILIAGDLFDSMAAQYATRSEVAATLRKLKDAGIPVVAVSGNHDWDALPAFANVHPDLIEILGINEWQMTQIAGVQVVGRSFPGQYTSNLLRNYPGFGDQLAIGLLHADVNAISRYNPTPLNSLLGRGVVAWIVGHVHAPKLWLDPLVLYPGSLQALDPAETGVHGFRWLEIEDASARFSELVPHSTVRYETVELSVRPDELLDDVISLYLSATRKEDEKLSLRVRLKRLNGARLEAISDRRPIGSDYYEVVDSTESVEATYDLETEAKATDARGQAARLLLGLENRGHPVWIDRASKLMIAVEREMTAARSKLNLGDSEQYRVLRDPEPGEAREAVRTALESVLASPIGDAR